LHTFVHFFRARLHIFTPSSLLVCVAAFLTFFLFSLVGACERKRTQARGNDFYKQGKYAEAVVEYSDGLRRDPANKAYTSRVFSNRANCYKHLGAMVESMQDCDACIEADPKWPKGYLRKGNLLNQLGQFQEAIEVFEKVLTIDPHSFDGWSRFPFHPKHSG
jgi:tetratricopeptide (TPR) repeat protein